MIDTDAHDTIQDEFDKVAEIWNDYDFVFCHVKYTDSRGEDGNFDAKVKVIEEVDAALPTLLDAQPGRDDRHGRPLDPGEVSRA